MIKNINIANWRREVVRTFPQRLRKLSCAVPGEWAGLLGKNEAPRGSRLLVSAAIARVSVPCFHLKVTLGGSSRALISCLKFHCGARGVLGVHCVTQYNLETSSF